MRLSLLILGGAFTQENAQRIALDLAPRCASESE